MAHFKDPFILFVVGPNGSGKSTLINAILKFFEQGNKNIEYLCPDIIASNLKDISDPLQKMRESQEIVKLLKNDLVDKQKSFIIESVGSHPSHCEFLIEAKSKGFSIATFFITTENPDINAERVANRVKNGGHDVPKDKIYSRYYKTMERLFDYIKISDCIAVADNSSSTYEAVFFKNEYGYFIFAEKSYIEEYIENNLKANNILYEVKSFADIEENDEMISDLLTIFDDCLKDTENGGFEENDDYWDDTDSGE